MSNLDCIALGARAAGGGYGRVAGRASAWLSYLTALVVGIAAAADLFPLATVLGTGGLWAMPGGDLAQNLTGHLAFQAGGWHWPLLLAPNLAWPHGTSIAMTDSNPLVSMLGKLLAGLRGRPANLLGVWFAACWLLQPVAAVYALRGFGCRSWIAALAAAMLAVSFPALLFRVGHVNLCGHFLLLFALGLALRMMRAAALPPRRWLAAAALLSVAVLCHPYLYVFAGAALAAPALQAVLERRDDALRIVGCYLAACIAPAALFMLLNGGFTGGGWGFGHYSMNLASPFWPQRSGLFGASLPVIDATGGQYEGFNNLGAGGLLLILLGIVALVRQGGLDWRKWRALIAILAVLTLLALSTRVYVGGALVLSLGVRPWDQIFGMIESTGRAFWLVGYALLLGSIAVLARQFTGARLGVLLAIVVVLQLIDTTPLRTSAQTYFAGQDQRPPAIHVPPGTAWLSTLPVCVPPGPAAEEAARLRLLAMRGGATLRDMRASRLPRWFNCESALTDGTELPLMRREMRVFLDPTATARFRQAVLGADTVCRSVGQELVCARDLPLDQGSPAGAGPALAAVDPPAELAGPALDKLLSYGWRRDAAGLLWSEGPRATLLFRVPPKQNGTLVVRMQLDGVGRKAGGARPITLHAGDGPRMAATLPDLRSASVEISVPEAAIADGIVRIAIDIDHPGDPRARNLPAPVNRAGVRLRAVQLSWSGAAGD